MVGPPSSPLADYLLSVMTFLLRLLPNVAPCSALRPPSSLLWRYCQKTRSLDGNRRAARKLLLQKLDDHVNGNLSKRNEKIEKLRRRKARRSAKSKQKYSKTEESSEQEEREEENEDFEEDEKDEDDEELADIDLAEHRFKAKKSK
eukprot:jgi/Phyca11/21224/fgenesh1_pg.PHYCAscaffold_86_\